MKTFKVIVASAAMLVGLTAFGPSPAAAEERFGAPGQIVRADHRDRRDFDRHDRRDWRHDRRDFHNRHDYRNRHYHPRPYYRHPGWDHRDRDRFGIFWHWNGRIH